MYKLFSLLLALLVSFNVHAQHFCNTTEMQNAWFAEHPELKEAFEKQQQEAAELDKELYKNGYKNANRSAAVGNYTIPIVFHILHLGGSENISDAQVIDAVNILTRDFNATNADTANVVGAFKNIIGNASIDFVLANKDPNGNCTNGIIRHYDANTDWQNTVANYAYTWPRTRYLNIYVVRTIGSGAAGYTYLPGSGIQAVRDAIVILSNYVGSIGTGNAGRSRALTHEVGHWLNLPHTWGSTNQPGVACGDDGVSDTPITRGFTSCNLNNTAICNPNIPENIQNYMDYAYCQRMFTIGQASRMQTAINSPVAGRNNLSSVNNLALTGITNPASNCIPNLNLVASPSFTVCSGKSLTISSFTFNAAPTDYLWTADNLASVSNPTAASTSVMFNSPGITNISCNVSNENGSNSASISVLVLDGTTQITGNYSESFEGLVSDPPALWKRITPTSPTKKWEIMEFAGSEGFSSMYIPGESFAPNTIAILETPSYDFKNNPGATFTFKHAYAMQNTSNKDVFKVQASRNCGGSWTDIWVPSNSNLASNSGGVSSELFFPFENQWKLKNLIEQPQFFSFRNEDHVLIRFYFMENEGGSGTGNRFYLDEVNFNAPVGVNELTKSISFQVYPNPVHSDVTISFHLSNAAQIKYTITSVTGAILMSEPEKNYADGAHEIQINTGNHLSSGIYFINLNMNGVNMSKKIIVD